jgi:NAD(P)H-dependent FMN reductase
VPTLLIVHHTTSPHLSAMLDAVLSGATDRRIQGVDVVVREALVATAVDALAADGYVLGTPANLGSMSGALKHFFDTVYYPCLEDTKGRPYGLYVHGGNDTTGAVRGVEAITTGLQWKRARSAHSVVGAPSKDDLEELWDLGASLAALLTLPG